MWWLRCPGLSGNDIGVWENIAVADPDAQARNRYFALVGTRLAGTAGAILGLVLIARGDAPLPKIVGTALVLSALLMIAIVPRALARRWRTPPEE